MPGNLAVSALKPAAEAVGLPWPSGFHVLRHTAASIMFSRGLNVLQVSRLLGHHSAAFTLERYTHLLPDDVPDVAFMDDVTAGGQTLRQTRRGETGPDEIPAETAEMAV